MYQLFILKKKNKYIVEFLINLIIYLLYFKINLYKFFKLYLFIYIFLNKNLIWRKIMSIKFSKKSKKKKIMLKK